jgi:APA family basic amino acid/polyamine antiporter
LVGNILGPGSFGAPAAVAAAASGGAGVGLWVLGALVALSGALCYAECAARLPRTGGFYVFYRVAFGEPVAFVGGWAALLVTYPASMAAIALVFAQYLGEAVPAVGARPTLAAAAALLAVGALNVVGVRAGAWTQRVLTLVKVAALGLLCLAAAFAAGRGGPPVAPPVPAPTGAAAALAAMVVVLWTYDGWSDVTLISGEIRDPGRNLARAVALGVTVLVVLYALVQLAVTTVLPAAQASASERVVAEAVRASLGPRPGALVAWLVVLSTLGSLHGIALTGSRLGFAMARDQVFPAAFGAVHPTFGTPARAVGVLIGAAVFYVFAAGFRGLLGYFSFSVWLFYGLTAVALLRLRHRGVGEPVPWRTPGGLAAPALVIFTAAVMTSALFWQNPGRSGAGLGMFAAGLLVYFVWRGWRRSVS